MSNVNSQKDMGWKSSNKMEEEFNVIIMEPKYDSHMPLRMPILGASH